MAKLPKFTIASKLWVLASTYVVGDVGGHGGIIYALGGSGSRVKGSSNDLDEDFDWWYNDLDLILLLIQAHSSQHLNFLMG